MKPVLYSWSVHKNKKAHVICAGQINQSLPKLQFDVIN